MRYLEHNKKRRLWFAIGLMLILVLTWVLHKDVIIWVLHEHVKLERRLIKSRSVPARLCPSWGSLFAVLIPSNRSQAKRSTNQAQHTYMFVGGFESGDLCQWDKLGSNNTANSKIEIVSDIVRAGNHAIKVTLGPNVAHQDKGKDRSELVQRTQGGRSKPGDEKYYGFSVLLPEQFESGKEYFFSVTQWHGYDTDIPPLTLEYVHGKLQMHRGRGRNIIMLGSVEKGRWFDMVFHVKWSANEDGFVEVWKDDVLISRSKGPTLNGPAAKGFKQYGTYVKFGGYRGKYIKSIQSFYLDEYRIGNSYAEVVPPTMTSAKHRGSKS